MRKRGKKYSKLINQHQYAGIMIKPRAGLDLLKRGLGSADHWVYVIGVFNVGFAIAHITNNKEFLAEARRALKALMNMTPNEEGFYSLPDGDLGVTIVAVFNAIDDYIKHGAVDKIDYALGFVQRAIEGTKQCPDIASISELVMRLADEEAAPACLT